MKRLATTAAAVILSASAAFSATIEPVFVESNNNRPFAEGDISGVRDIGTIGAGQHVGIAGRIVTAVDTWRFTTVNDWSISFVNLLIDDQRFFDSSDIEVPPGTFRPNGATSAQFSIFEIGNPTALLSVNITATDGGFGTEGALDFSAGAGTYRLRIDGDSGSRGATYDIAVSTVPLPAAGFLLLAAIGGAAAFKRRRRET